MNKILLVDPSSIHHGPPDAIQESDSFINQLYVDKINEVVDCRCSDNYGRALHSKYITNYGLLMLGGLLKDYNVSYINGDYFPTSEAYIDYLLKTDADIVCLTSTTPQFMEVKKIAELLKKTHPDIKIILGGPHSRYYLTHEVDDCFDCVVIGYDVNQSKEVIDKIIRDEEFPNKIVTTHYYDTEKDFSLIPSDKLYDTMLYSYINFGCPNQCKYCVEHKFVDKVAFNDCNVKMDEIKRLVLDYGIRFVHIADSDFLMFRKMVEEFVKYIKQEKINFCFSINTSPAILEKYIGDPLLKELKEIGLVEILIGAEHFSHRVMDKLSKHYCIDNFMNALEYAKKDVGIPIISLYTLVGLPFEYEEDIEENIMVIRQLKEQGLFDFTFPKFFVPYPDSDIYLHPDDYDVIIKNENWDEYQRWQLPRPIIINGMHDDDYVNEIIQINHITMEDDYEDDSISSLCKKR